MRIIVAGMVAGTPHHGGATWAVLQYVLGLQQLGHDVLLVEPLPPERLADPAVRSYFQAVAGEFGLGRAATLVPDRETRGFRSDEAASFAKDADLLLNISGMLDVAPLFEPVATRVYLDLDPAFNQLWCSAEGIDRRFAGHTHFVTVGLSMNDPQCQVPSCGRSWITTVPPVVLERWPCTSDISLDAFTTVGSWRSYGSITHDGRFYGQKAHSFRPLLPLPERCGERFAPALGIDPGDRRDLAALHDHGWELRDPAAEAGTPAAYQRFVQSSRAELGVAKSGYVTSRCGWFSDRSAAYLASGRPVVALDTGFSSHLPVGEGLLAFNELDEAVECVASVMRRYPQHARAARALAEAEFGSRVVLERLIEAVAA